VDAFLAEKQPKEEEEEEAEAEAEEAASSSSSEDDEEEPAPKKAKTSAKGKGGAAKAKGSGGGGFQKPLKLSPAMQQFTGEERLSRAQIVKKCWVRLTFRFLSFSPSLVVVVVFVIFVVVVSFSVLSRTLSRNAYKKKETNPF
jgi:cobalamin biosynthesis Mg chelatase CobN